MYENINYVNVLHISTSKMQKIKEGNDMWGSVIPAQEFPKAIVFNFWKYISYDDYLLIYCLGLVFHIKTQENINKYLVYFMELFDLKERC